MAAPAPQEDDEQKQKPNFRYNDSDDKRILKLIVGKASRPLLISHEARLFEG